MTCATIQGDPTQVRQQMGHPVFRAGKCLHLDLSCSGSQHYTEGQVTFKGDCAGVFLTKDTFCFVHCVGPPSA